MIPTLLGIMIINFALIQFVPGGPIEQIINQIEDGGSGAFYIFLKKNKSIK